MFRGCPPGAQATVRRSMENSLAAVDLFCYPLEQGISTALLTFGAQEDGAGWRCPVHCGKFSSIPGLCLLDAGSTRQL